MLRSFVYAFRGLFHTLRSQKNFRIHLILLCLVILLGAYLDIRPWEWVAIVFCSGLVLCTELINTALEETVNYISMERHPQAGLIKDVAAGAVLLSAITVLVTACIIFIPYFWANCKP